MKKLLATILCLVMLLSSTACSIKIFEKEITDLSGKSESSATEGAITEKKEKEYKEVTKKKLLGAPRLPVQYDYGEFRGMDVSKFTKIFQKYDYKYMVTDYWLENDPYAVSAVPRDELENMYCTAALETHVEDFENAAILIMQTLTKKTSEQDYNISYQANLYSAFNTDLTQKYSLLPDEFFEEQKFSISCENVKILQLLGSSNWIDDACPAHCMVALVSADVTCENNDGALSTIEWVPAIGQTRNINFLIYFACDSATEVFLTDIAVFQ